MWHKNAEELKHSKKCKEVAKSFHDRKLLCKVNAQSIVAVLESRQICLLYQ